MGEHTTRTLARFGRWQEQRGLAPATIRTRRIMLRRWLDDMGPDWHQADPIDVELWLAQQADWSPATRRRVAGDLATLWRWAQRCGLCASTPMPLVERPRTPRRLPRPATEADLAATMAAGGRLWLCSALAGYAGLRVAEVAALDWREVDLQAGWLTVRNGKGGRDRVVPITAALADVLRPLWSSTGPVVAQRNGRPLTANSLGSWWRAGLRSAGCSCTPHQLRHRFATQLHRVCGDLLVTQQALGHSSPATTAIYAAVAPGRLADAMAAM